MVEFAIITPLLLLVFFGITELGRALYQETTLTNAVEGGARYLARVPPTVIDNETCDIIDATAWTAAIGNAKKLIIYGNMYGKSGDPVTLPGLDDTDESDITIQIENNPNSAPDVSACVITVSAEVSFSSIFGPEYSIPPIPFIGSSGTGGLSAITLNAVAQERYIGE